MSSLTRTFVLSLLLIAAIGLLAGCSSGDSDADSTKSTSTSSDAASSDDDADATAVTAKLDLRLEKVGSKDGGGIPVPVGMRCTMSIPATCMSVVECPVAEESKEQDAQAVCAWLAGEGKTVLTKEPAEDEVCTQQFGGPEIATVKGTLDGADVDATFSRENGCAISRFDEVMPLWTAGTEPDAVDDPPSAFDE